MIKFEYQYDENSPKITVELHPDTSLPDLIQSFQDFLKGAGYVFDGELDFTEEETNVNA